MSLVTTEDRETVIRTSERRARRWSTYVDTLLDAFHASDGGPASLASKMEELRNKRDSVLTKVEALKRHKATGWSAARAELRDAQSELRGVWRSVISTLDKECVA